MFKNIDVEKIISDEVYVYQYHFSEFILYIQGDVGEFLERFKPAKVDENKKVERKHYHADGRIFSL